MKTTTNFDFIIAVNDFASDVYDLITEAEENVNIHVSHTDFVNDKISDIVNELTYHLEEMSFEQQEFKELMNGYFSEIEYQRREAQNKGFMNVYRFYNSVIDRWNEFVDTVENTEVCYLCQ